MGGAVEKDVDADRPGPSAGIDSRVPSWLTFAMVLLLPLVLAGCAAKEGGGMIRKALETVGLKEPAESPNQPKSVKVQMFAGQNLNAGRDNRSLALVVRVYRLRQSSRFEQASFDAFLDEDTERRALGDDLLGATEIVLQPGQRHEIVELVPPEAGAVGVVALFRSPASKRWRLSFDSKLAAKDGIAIGLHACALTTSSPGLTTSVSGGAASLVGVRCGQ